MKSSALARVCCRGRWATLMVGSIAASVATGCQQSDLIRQPFSDIEQARIERPLSQEDCRADLAELAALVERATPRPFLRRSREEVEQTFKRLGDELPPSMTRRQFVGVLREASAAYGIGHQYTVFPHEDFNAWVVSGGRSPRVTIAIREDAILIRDTGEHDLPAGARLEELNGWPAERLLAILRARTSADTPAQRDDAIEGRFASLVWELGMEAPYTIVARGADGAPRRVVDAGRAPARRSSLFDRSGESRDGGTPQRERSFSLEWLAPDIACIRWTKMDPREKDAWEAFVRETATALQDRGAAGLIVDIRSNSGGTSSLAWPLLGMISDRPARMSGGKVWRKSEDYDRFLESCVVWWARGLGWRSSVSAEYASMKLNEERVIEGQRPAPYPFAGPRFTGNVVVLIGPRTFSSAVMAADAIGTYDLATLAGRPTGGVPNSHGEVGFARLARSGLIVSFSSAQFIRASGDATDISPVTPDVLISETPATNGVDRELEAAVGLIRDRTPRAEKR